MCSMWVVLHLIDLCSVSLSPRQCFTLLGVVRKCTPSPTFEAVKPAVISLSGPLSPAKEDVYFAMYLMN